jgi:hypothetical protein
MVRGDSEGKSMCSSGVLKRTEKKAHSRFKNLLAAFSVQANKQDCIGDE